MKHRIAMAAGREPAETLIINAKVVDVFSGQVRQDAVAMGQGVFVGFGHREAHEVVDAQGAYLLPGLIDGHIHMVNTEAYVPPQHRASAKAKASSSHTLPATESSR